jgi:hypothetical protein
MNLLGHKCRGVAIVKFSGMISQMRPGGVDVVHLVQNLWYSLGIIVCLFIFVSSIDSGFNRV